MIEQGRAGVWWPDRVGGAVRIGEREVPGPVGLQYPVLLVHEVVVVPAQHDQFIVGGGAAVDPVSGMVDLTL